MKKYPSHEKCMELVPSKIKLSINAAVHGLAV